MRNIADARRKPVETQPNVNASIENSVPMVGIAILIAKTLNGKMKFARLVTSRVIFFIEDSDSSFHLLIR